MVKCCSGAHFPRKFRFFHHEQPHHEFCVPHLFSPYRRKKKCAVSFGGSVSPQAKFFSACFSSKHVCSVPFDFFCYSSFAATLLVRCATFEASRHHVYNWRKRARKATILRFAPSKTYSNYEQGASFCRSKAASSRVTKSNGPPGYYLRSQQAGPTVECDFTLAYSLKLPLPLQPKQYQQKRLLCTTRYGILQASCNTTNKR